MAKGLERRDFLRGTTAIGAGLMLSPALLAQTGAGGSNTINAALLGAGTQGELLMSTCLKMAPDTEIRFKAVCDIWENLTLRRVSGILKRYHHEATAYVDYKEMLAQETDLDVVIIATPDFCHAEQAVACLNAGLHVYCEAPMSNTSEGAKQMAQAAAKAGKQLQIGYQRRSNPRYRHCLENLLGKAKLLGRVTAANATWNRPFRSDRGWSKRRLIPAETLEKYGYQSMHQLRNWMWYKGLGTGPVGFFGSHQIDVLNWFVGTPPNTVTARGGTYFYDQKNHDWFDTVMGVYDYETDKGPVSAYLQSINNNGYGGNKEVFMGDQGSIELSESKAGVYRDPEAPDWEKWVKLGFLRKPGDEKKAAPSDEAVVDMQQSQPPDTYQIPVDVEDAYAKAHLANFFGAVKGQASLNCSGPEAYATTVATLKINQAVESKQTVTFKPEDFSL